MPTDLDRAIEATVAKLTTAEGPLSIGYVEKYGHQMPYMTKAPANLREYQTTHYHLNSSKIN